MLKQCRLCGKKSNKCTSLFNTFANDENNVHSLANKINSFLPIAISECNDLPSHICEKCSDQTNGTYDFIQEILSVQKAFHSKQNPVGNTSQRKTRASERQQRQINSKSALHSETEDIPQPCNRLKYGTTTISSTSGSIGVAVKSQKAKSENGISETLKKLKLMAKNLTISKTNVAKKPNFAEIKFQAMDCSFENSSNSDNNDEKSDEPEQNESDDNGGDDGEDSNYDIKESQSDASLDSFDEDDDDDEYEPMKRARGSKRSSNSSNKLGKPYAHHKSISNRNEKDYKLIKMKAPPVYICLKCKTKFASFKLLKDHMSGTNDCTSSQKTCEICGKMFQKKKTLSQHLKYHEEKPKFVCDQCGKVYTNRFNLENHKSSQHGEYFEEDGHTYKCRLCESQFTNRTDLYAHMKNHEKIPISVLCDTCGKCFPSADALRSHNMIHLDIRPFACTYCPKKFRTRLLHAQHLHVHTGIKTFSCTECPRSFAKRDSLVAHRRTHTGEMPYQCEHCPAKFNLRSKLKKHISLHAGHMDGQSLDVTEPNIYLVTQ